MKSKHHPRVMKSGVTDIIVYPGLVVWLVLGAPILVSSMEQYHCRSVDVMAIYYDFMPTSHESSKAMWVQLRYPPPLSLGRGTMVSLSALDHNLKLPPKPFEVVDVNGTRVTIRSPLTSHLPSYSEVVPFVPSPPAIGEASGGYSPLSHSPHWAYTLKDWVDTLGDSRSWTFGSGVSVARMVW